MHALPAGTRLPRRRVLTSRGCLDPVFVGAQGVPSQAQARALNPALPEVRAGTSDQGLVPLLFSARP